MIMGPKGYRPPALRYSQRGGRLPPIHGPPRARRIGPEFPDSGPNCIRNNHSTEMTGVV